MIQVPIPTQGFERIRDRIMTILLTEFNNQVVSFYNTDCEGVKFFAERLVTMDKTEADYINISLLKGDYSNKDVDYVDGTYQYVLEIVTNAKNEKQGNEIIRGDKLANFRLQRLMGIVRYILEASMYAKLNFESPFIMHTELSKFQIYKPEPGQDGVNNAFAQAVFTVRAAEVTDALEAPYVAGSMTNVQLELTENGYMYGEVYTPPRDERYAYIVDQLGTLVALVPGGDEFVITRFKNLIDTIVSNQTNITDNIIN